MVLQGGVFYEGGSGRNRGPGQASTGVVQEAGGKIQCAAKRKHMIKRSKRLLPESQGHNLALTASYVPCSLERGGARAPFLFAEWLEGAPRS